MPQLEIEDDMVVSEEDLHSRREVDAHDFRPTESRRPALSDAGPVAMQSGDDAATTQSAADLPLDELAERRARRSDDPEDLINRRGNSLPRRAAADAEVIGRAPGNDERPLYLEPKASDATSKPRQTARGKDAKAPLVAAGETVAAVLAMPLELQGGSATVAVSYTHLTLPTSDLV